MSECRVQDVYKGKTIVHECVHPWSHELNYNENHEYHGWVHRLTYKALVDSSMVSIDGTTEVLLDIVKYIEG